MIEEFVNSSTIKIIIVVNRYRPLQNKPVNFSVAGDVKSQVFMFCVEFSFYKFQQGHWKFV